MYPSVWMQIVVTVREDCWVHKFSDGSSIEINNGDPVIYADLNDYLSDSNQYLDDESGLIMSNDE